MFKMTPPDIEQVMGMSRVEAIDHLLRFQGTFKLDFTREYLQTLSDEQVHHILLAACLHACRCNDG